MKYSEYISSDYLHINTCGKQYLSDTRLGSFRPYGREDWHILYICKGTCFITENGKETPVESGNVIFYRPNEPQQYEFKEKSGAVSYFVHFSGVGCETVFNKLEIPASRIVFVGKDVELKQMFDSLVYEFSLKQRFYQQMCHGHLINILAFIGRRLSLNALQTKYDLGKSVTDVCKYMYENHSNNLSVAEYARMCNLSESRFAHIFKDMMGVSPKQYVINIQMQKAKELLETTHMSISQISDIVGMQNQYYFSRIFKKHMKMSPMQWRNSH